MARIQARPSKPSLFAARSVDEFLAELTNLEPAEIQERLSDYKRVSMTELRALAVKLELGSEDRVSRQDLVDQIVKIGFANQRGYESLRKSRPTP